MENLHEQMDEIREYNELLETVLLALCEELDLDPQALVENAQLHEYRYDPEHAAAYRAGDRAPGDREREARHKAWDKVYAERAKRERDIKSGKVVKEDALTADRGREWDTATSRAHEDLARARAAHKKKSSDATLAKVRKAQDRLRDVGYKRSDEEQSNKIYHRGGKVVGTRGEDRYEDR